MSLPTWTLLPAEDVPCTPTCAGLGAILVVNGACFWCRSPGADLVPVLDPDELRARDKDDASYARREMRERELRSEMPWEGTLVTMAIAGAQGL